MIHSLPLAFSLSSSIKSVGAYAGFAALIGLAVLAMLYFAQARELERLGEWAERLPERLPAAASAAARPVARTTVAAAAPVASAAAASSAAGAAEARSTAASRPGPPQQQVAQAAPPVAGAPSAVAAPSAPKPGPPAGAPKAATPAGAAPAPPASPRAPTSAPEGVPPHPQPPAAPPAAPSAPRVPPRPSVPPREATTVRPAAGAGGAAAVGAAAAAGGGARRAPQPLKRSPAASRTARDSVRRDSSSPAPKSSSGRRTALRLGGVLVGLLAVVLVATQLLGGAGSKRSNALTGDRGAGTANARGGTGGSGSTLAQSSVTVSVLNGTRTAGLAGKVADALAKSGYHRGAVANAPTQAHVATLIGYARGGKSAAQGVARAINVDPATVTALDPATAARAPGAQVVVTVGSDRKQ